MKRLDLRLAAVLFALLLSAGLGTLALTLWTVRSFGDELEQSLNRHLADELIHVHPDLSSGAFERDELKSFFMAMMAVNPRIELYLVDDTGQIVAFDAPPDKVKLEHIDTAPLNRYLGGSPLPIYGDDPKRPGHRNIFSAAMIGMDIHGDGSDGSDRSDRSEVPDSTGNPSADITDGSSDSREPGKADSAFSKTGYLYVVLSGERFGSMSEGFLDSSVLRVVFTAVAFGVLVSALAGWLLVRWLTRRLRRLDQRLINFATEEPGAPSAGTQEGDELDRLETSFDAMATRIKAQVQALERQDHLRRELVANVSHDLRTPLATLRGYLETLAHLGDELGTEERSEALEIACRQSERLGERIDSLFELAKLDAEETPPQREPFAPAELILDTVQSWQATYRERLVDLRADVPRDLPTVEGDLGLLSRVFDNILDNALGHSPAGGTVRLHAEVLDHHLCLHVDDDGPGIPPEQLVDLFERFVRGPESGRHGGAGLGLAISRRIIALHGGTLTATNRPDGGARFEIRLPCAEKACSA